MAQCARCPNAGHDCPYDLALVAAAGYDTGAATAIENMINVSTITATSAQLAAASLWRQSALWRAQAEPGLCAGYHDWAVECGLPCDGGGTP